MDSNEAQASLQAAREAHQISAPLKAPIGISVAAAVAAGAGVALGGASPASGGIKLVLVVVAAVLLAVAYLLPALHRSRRGLHGFRGQVRADNTVLLICLLAVLISGLRANADLSKAYDILGVLVAVAYFALLRGWLRSRS
ncbi:MAG TPA: hypothetical protein VHO01_05035 [Jatrophihabitans sp.]|nr:hypothetical protein [Jatrophihabitans sp.]